MSDAVILYLSRICGNCVRRKPMKPVSRMTSKMSVKGTGGNEFHRLEPSAHLTFLLAGNRAAVLAIDADKAAIAVRRVMRGASLLNSETQQQVIDDKDTHQDRRKPDTKCGEETGPDGFGQAFVPQVNGTDSDDRQ